MLTVLTWLWGGKYGREDLRKLRDGVARHLSPPYRFVCVTDRDDFGDICETAAIPEVDLPLTRIQGCFARLRAFDPAWQEVVSPVSRAIVWIDLDVVVTGLLDPLFPADPPPLKILGGANASNPCPYNGSLVMIRPGHHREVWQLFTLDAARKAPCYEFPDDQGWIAHMVPGAPTWPAGEESGIYAFQKPGWPKGEELPEGARLVVFPGWRSPAKFSHVPWVADNWR